MKEAAGEANMTVITIVLIAIVLGVGTIIVRSMMNNTSKGGCCQSNGGIWHNNSCYAPSECNTTADGVLKCTGTGSVSTKCTNTTTTTTTE